MAQTEREVELRFAMRTNLTDDQVGEFGSELETECKVFAEYISKRHLLDGESFTFVGVEPSTGQSNR